MTARRNGEEAVTEIQPAADSEPPMDPGQEGGELAPRPPDWPAATPENVRKAWPAPDSFQERPLEWPRPPQVSGAIDVAAFIKAQSDFVGHQSYFLREGVVSGEDYPMKLRDYSHAQDDYIAALHGILSQLGVM